MRGGFLVVAATIACAMPHEAVAQSRPVVLLEAPPSEIVIELAGELGASGFEVRRQDGDGPDAPPFATVALDVDRGRVSVHAATELEGTRSEMTVTFGPKQRLSRRRAWIAVVEHLRMMNARAEAPPVAVRPAPAPAATIATPAPAAPPAVSLPPSDALGRYTLGAGSALAVSGGGLGTLSHLLVLGEMWSESRRVAGFARLDWPLLGREVQSERIVTRFWTAKLGVGVVARARGFAARLRPFLGAGPGLQVLLLETSAATNDARFRLAFDARVFVGARVRFVSGFDVFLQLEGGTAIALGWSGIDVAGRRERLAGPYVGASAGAAFDL